MSLSRLSATHVVCICAFVGFVQYSASLGHSFVLDDASSVIGAAHTTDGVRLPLLEETVNGQGRFYRPFSYLGFSIDYALYGTEAWGFHLTCVILHTAACAIFAWLAFVLVGSGAGLVAGCLFAVHPVHVEAVANIWNRSGVQSAIFVFAAIACWIRIERLWFNVLILNVLAFIAVGSKEGAVALPVLLVAVVWLREGGRLSITPALYCGPAYSAWLWLRHSALGERPTFGALFTDQALDVRLYTLGEIFAHNMRLLFVPVSMRADYSEPTTSMLTSLTPLGGIGWIGVVILVALLGWAIRRKHWSALGIGWVIASIWPFLHLVIPLGVPVAERWLYVASGGVCLLFGQMIWRLRQVLRPLVWGAFVSVILLGASGLAFQRTMEWSTPLTLWSADAAKENASAFTWGNYGLSLWEEGHHSDALKAMMHARNLKPDWPVYELKYQEMRSLLREVASPGEGSTGNSAPRNQVAPN